MNTVVVKYTAIGYTENDNIRQYNRQVEIDDTEFLNLLAEDTAYMDRHMFGENIPLITILDAISRFWKDPLIDTYSLQDHLIEEAELEIEAALNGTVMIEEVEIKAIEIHTDRFTVDSECRRSDVASLVLTNPAFAKLIKF